MSWWKKTNSDLLGVALDDLVSMLDPTSIDASIEGNTLRANHCMSSEPFGQIGL